MSLTGDKPKDIRISIRLSSLEEKILIAKLANELGMNSSEFIKAKTFGVDLTSKYIDLIEDMIEDEDFEYEDEPFTLKRVLKDHWKFMSVGDCRHLINEILELIENDEIDLEVFKISKKGKVRFIKADDISYDRWRTFNFYNFND